MKQFKRSRLVRKSDDLVTRKTIFWGMVTLVVFVLILVFGLPFLIRFSLLLGETRRGGEGVAEKIVPPLAPRIFVPYEATNSAKIAISGVAEPGVMVELNKDGMAIGQTEVSEGGEFLFNEISLNLGTNVFQATATTKKGVGSEVSKDLVIDYDNQPPTFNLSNPGTDTITVDSADFDVVGKSDKKEVSVLVGGLVAMVDDDGNFKKKLQLNQGKNEIEIIVRDTAGNESRKKIVITCDI